MALDQDYATVEEFKRYLRIPGTYEGTLNTENDPYDDLDIELVLSAASRTIDRFTNRYFGLADEEETRYYTATRVGTHYEVQINDLMTASGLVISLDDLCNGTYTRTLDTTDYRMHPANAAVKGYPWTTVSFNRGITVPTVDVGIAVTAKYGWTEVPATIKKATLLQASRLFKRRDAPFGIAGSAELGSELRLLARLDPDVEVLCLNYRHWWAAT